MPVSIMLDAGHGGRDPGAVYNGRQEKDDVLKLVLAIGEILQNSGIDVEYTRTTDIYETPFQKATEANEAGVDFFISIHRNSSPLANQYMGVESLIYNLSGIKYEMAENINAQLETVGFKDLGVKARPNLVVLQKCRRFWSKSVLSILILTTLFSIRTSMILRRQLQMESWIRWKKKGSGNQKAQETVRPHRNPEGLLLMQILLIPFLLLTVQQNQMLVP